MVFQIRSSRRPAFTLLEVLLASTIGVLLMGALYVAVSMQLRHAQVARQVVEQSTLVRALLTRMDSDISTNIGPVPPVIASSSGGSSGMGGGGGGGGSAAGSGTGSAGGSSTTGATGTGSGSTGSSGSSSSSSSTASTTSSNAVQFNLMVQGDATHLVLYVSKVPRELNWNMDPSNTDGQPAVTDQRRITYWLVGGGDSPLGLARQEYKPVTSSDAATNVPPDVPDEPSYVIAEEVKSLNFSYFDGSSWQDTWDGTAPGADGTTPQGPPLAIAITIGIANPGANGEIGGPDNLKTFRHVVAIPTANGLPQQTTTTNQ
jgi:hypothetical protein